MPTQRDEFGLRGERIAERYLRKAGLKILARRFDTPVGELDLVFLDGQTIVFVEVKTQRDRKLLDPYERVTIPKQRKLTSAARWFLKARRFADRPCRFDVISVVAPEDGEPMVQHIRDAFTPAR